MQQILCTEYFLWIKIEKAQIFFFEILITGSPASREYSGCIVISVCVYILFRFGCFYKRRRVFLPMGSTFLPSC